ncbi:MAG: transcription antitermination factor NusB [Selenomonadaceae bacterium]
MSRRKSREVAMQALFQLDMNPADSEDVNAVNSALDAAWKTHEKENEVNVKETDETKDYEYAKLLLKGTLAHIEEIDKAISSVSKDWKLNRMAGIDRAIIRLAFFEIQNVEGVTAGIAINEAVELAKKFGADKSKRFVNGVLASLVNK